MITEVRVAQDGEPAAAKPSRRWRPLAEPESGLKIEHRPGESLDAAWVRRQFLVNGLIGRGATVDRGLALVQLINRSFVRAGFVNSGLIVPPQPELASGILDLRLIYGRLVAPASGGPALVVAWQDGRSQGLGADFVRRRMPAASRRPLNAADIERDFRLLADDPAIVTVNADLRPGSRPGEATLHLLVRPQDRSDLYLTAANNRSPSVGGERAAVGGFLRNVIAGGDILSGEFGLTEGVEDGSLSYSVPFLTPRTSLSLRGSINNAAVIDRPLIPLDIESRDRSAELGIMHKLIDRPLTPQAEPGQWSSARTLSAGMLLTHRESRSFLLGEPFSFSPGSVDGRSEYSAVRLVGDFIERNVRHVFAASATWTIGLDGTRSRLPAIPNPPETFQSLLVQLNYARRLSAKGLELRARVAAQHSNGFLYSGERFSVGGESSVRGYRENLFLTDRGALASVELSHPFSLGRRSGGDRRVDWGAFAASVFADGATVWNARPPHPRPQTIGSIGASLAWTPSDALTARISYGKALNKVDLAGSQDIQDHGIHFRITLRPFRFFD
ncbi:MAG TPA: ShlB/FhaC/HecB family hemolysin secretion/activation protein [Allosphingosinicella sp.]|nr:ShlB/FhaC/HecB family hemolysin secretion/activation protein [Allosphingosinicella sp.]